MSDAKGVVDRVGDPDEVRCVVAELLKIVHETGLERTVAIGRLVLDRFFGGSSQLWRDRRRNKNNSVRRLADCPDCPLSRSALNQAIGVYSVVEALPAAKSFQHIGASHISLVLPFSARDRESWLTRANDEHWSVRRLGEETRRDRRQKGERRGRPRLSTTNRALGRVRGPLLKLEMAVLALHDVDLERADERELARLAERLSVIEAKILGVCRSLRPDSGIVTKTGVDAVGFDARKAG
jgi:hypothetical protein